MFKIFINNGENDIPNDDIFYIIGKEGIFIKKSLGLIDSITPVNNISILDNVKPYVKLNIKKIPSNIFAKSYIFFKIIYEKYKSEAILLLFYNEKTCKYKLIPPKQEISSTLMTYDRNIIIENYTMIGDIHSHGNMSAFHSSTDDLDEESFDGLHITIGNITDSHFSISSSIVVNGYRNIVEPLEYINGIIKQDKKIDVNLNILSKIYDYENEFDNNYNFITNDNKLNNRYIFINNILEKTKINSQWIKQVTKKQLYSKLHHLKNQDIINNEWFNFDINDNNINNSNYNYTIKNNIEKDEIIIYKCDKCNCILRKNIICPNCLTDKYTNVYNEEQFKNYIYSLEYVTCEVCKNKYLKEDYKNECPFCYMKPSRKSHILHRG
jgi:PRTRC genetic system protein A